MSSGPNKSEAQIRKDRPVFSGVLRYFPDALLEVAELSRIGNEQHNPGQPLHWAKGKSTDHNDALLRHLIDTGTRDTDGVRHAAKVAWRALAQLQTEIENERPTEQRGGLAQGGGDWYAEAEGAEINFTAGVGQQGSQIGGQVTKQEAFKHPEYPEDLPDYAAVLSAQAAIEGVDHHGPDHDLASISYRYTHEDKPNWIVKEAPGIQSNSRFVRKLDERDS